MMDDLSQEQRSGLQATAERIFKLLELCVGGSVTPDARSYSVNNLLGAANGSLTHAANLFRRQDPRTKQRPVHFPGSLAIEAIPYAWGISGMLKPSAKAAKTFKTDDWDSESLQGLRRILDSLHDVLRTPILHGQDEPTRPMHSSLFVDALLAAYRVDTAVKADNAAECLNLLEEPLATAYWKCLMRLGWWAPESCETAVERISWWLFRNDIELVERIDGEERRRIETPADRATQAVERIEDIASQAETDAGTCLEVYTKTCLWLNRVEQGELPLAYRSFHHGFERDIERDLYFWCFDVECISRTLNWAAEKHGLSQRPQVVAEEMLKDFNCHPTVAIHRAKQCLQDSLRQVRAEWMHAIYDRGELTTGWEVSDNALPWAPIKGASQLSEWLSVWLKSIHDARAAGRPWQTPESYLGDIQRELRNSRRSARNFPFTLPQNFTAEPADIFEAEEQLVSLVAHLKGSASESNAEVQVPTETEKVLSNGARPIGDPSEELGAPTGESKPFSARDTATTALGEENTQSGAPQLKEKLPNDPEILAFLKAFRRTWTAERETTQYCEDYAEKNIPGDDNAGNRLRRYVYRYLNMNK